MYRAERARGHAFFTANAFIIIYEHATGGRVFIYRPGRADRDTRSNLALFTAGGYVQPFLINAHYAYPRQVWRKTSIVLERASKLAGPAAGTQLRTIH